MPTCASDSRNQSDLSSLVSTAVLSGVVNSASSVVLVCTIMSCILVLVRSLTLEEGRSKKTPWARSTKAKSTPEHGAVVAPEAGRCTAFVARKTALKLVCDITNTYSNNSYR